MSSRITGTTKLAGVIGWPLEHTLSPAMHNAAYEDLGLDWVYVPLARPRRGWRSPSRCCCALASIRGLQRHDAVQAARARPLRRGRHGRPDRGRRQHRPRRRRCAHRLQHRRPGAARVARIARPTSRPRASGRGARRGRRGVLGGRRAHPRRRRERGDREPRLGAGRGARRARRACSAGTRTLRACRSTTPGEAVREADLVVNATPVGMRPEDPTPVPAEWLRPEQVVSDMVYGSADRSCSPTRGLPVLTHRRSRHARVPRRDCRRHLERHRGIADAAGRHAPRG